MATTLSSGPRSNEIRAVACIQSLSPAASGVHCTGLDHAPPHHVPKLVACDHDPPALGREPKFPPPTLKFHFSHLRNICHGEVMGPKFGCFCFPPSGLEPALLGILQIHQPKLSTLSKCNLYDPSRRKHPQVTSPKKCNSM